MGCKNSLISRGALAIANAPLFLILSQSKNGTNPAKKQAITAYKLQA